jgi:hypothetical protein
MVGRVSLQLRSCSWSWAWREKYTDKKENEIFLICKEIQMRSVAKSFMRKGFLIYEEMRQLLTIHEEAVGHI